MLSVCRAEWDFISQPQSAAGNHLSRLWKTYFCLYLFRYESWSTGGGGGRQRRSAQEMNKKNKQIEINVRNNAGANRTGCGFLSDSAMKTFLFPSGSWWKAARPRRREQLLHTWLYLLVSLRGNRSFRLADITKETSSTQRVGYFGIGAVGPRGGTWGHMTRSLPCAMSRLQNYTKAPGY